MSELFPGVALPRASVHLSVILPFYRKLAEFQQVLPLNVRYLARPGVEVLIVMDDPDEEAGLLELLRGYPAIRCKVIVNDRAHAWRPPCVAINVGLRHAQGKTVLICSPESAFVTDVPGHALMLGHLQPSAVAFGRVAFARFSELKEHSLAALLERGVRQTPGLFAHYGSIIAPRSALESVQGYDESQTVWGGDDDHLRIRLEMAGYPLNACPDIGLLHLSFAPRTGFEAYDDFHAWERCTPEQALANTPDGWGRAFSRVALDAPAQIHAAGATSVELGGTLYAYRSRRRCDVCGRYVHHEPPLAHCAKCDPVGLAARQAAPSPRIVALMQVRNESRYLQGCLDHLRGHVDGFIALDDGSTDGTQDILRSEKTLLELLANPASSTHQWRERENQVRLLNHARQHGAEWVLACDADERYETQFLSHLRGIVQSLSVLRLPALGFMLRELWDVPHQYRMDGIWGRKTQVRLFRLPPAIRYSAGSDLHGGWCPDDIKRAGQLVQTGYNLYHLGSLRSESVFKVFLT